MKNSILLIIIVVILASTNYAQLDITTFTNKRVYEYGEKIELYCKITNNADTTFEFFAPTYQSCQAEFSFNDFKSWEHTGCLATVELLTFTPHTSKIYKWVIDPTKTGLPNNEGTQKIICSYYFNLADTFFIDAPQYLGGQLSVGYNLENSDSIQLIKDSLNIVLMEQHYYNNIVNEIWQVEGFQIDSLMNKYANNYLFNYIENATHILYDSIYNVNNIYIDESLNYYPLEVGNKWYYNFSGQTYDSNSEPFLQQELWETTGDTLMPNGYTYFITKRNTVQSSLIFERIDSSTGKVYGYNENIQLPNNEYLIVDLSLSIKNSPEEQLMNFTNPILGTYLKDTTKIIKTSIDQYLEKTREYFATGGQYGICDLTRYIGISNYYYEFDFGYRNWTLEYAIVNGQKFGDSTLVGINDKKSNLPLNFSLSQNYPNPFNPITTIEYSIPVKNENFHSLQLIIYDILGREIRTLVNLPQKAGTYRIEFDGSDLASGIYYYQIKTENFIITKKMILLK